jgi:transposase
VVSAVARRPGPTPQQLFGWRRAARRLTEDGDDVGPPRFVPAVVEETKPEPEPVRAPRKRRRVGRSGNATGLIEVEIGGVTVRVGRGADAKTVAAVIHALKGKPPVRAAVEF